MWGNGIEYLKVVAMISVMKGVQEDQFLFEPQHSKIKLMRSFVETKN